MTGKSNKKSFKGAGLLIFLLLFSLPFFIVFSFIDHHFDSLPYFGDKEVITTAEGTSDTLYYQVPDFELIDQNGNSIHSDSLKGRIYLATFFSTESPYISKITKRLLHANFRYRNEPDIALVCFSTNPLADTPERLKEYTQELRVEDEKFHFFTSSDSTIIDVIAKGYLTPDYANSSRLWLVDTEGYLRGKYNGNREEEIQRALEDIALLKKELDIIRYEAKKSAEGNE